ncbi:MAG: DUF4810 domain-containing protein [Bacteroidales bacterium]|nr:DUF4810 domain-containing protein [Bacteroidales bacterium]
MMNLRKLSVILSVFLSAMLLPSCGTTSVSYLYYWGNDVNSEANATAYEVFTYDVLENRTPESICNLIALYEDIVTNAGKNGKDVPPGILAEYGYVLLQSDSPAIFEEHATKLQKKMFNTADYSSLFRQKGESMLKKEMELYPESAKFIAPLIDKLVK